jgi:hypothetical protein
VVRYQSWRDCERFIKGTIGEKTRNTSPRNPIDVRKPSADENSPIWLDRQIKNSVIKVDDKCRINS